MPFSLTDAGLIMACYYLFLFSQELQAPSAGGLSGYDSVSKGVASAGAPPGLEAGVKQHQQRGQGRKVDMHQQQVSQGHYGAQQSLQSQGQYPPGMQSGAVRGGGYGFMPAPGYEMGGYMQQPQQYQAPASTQGVQSSTATTTSTAASASGATSPMAASGSMQQQQQQQFGQQDPAFSPYYPYYPSPYYYNMNYRGMYQPPRGYGDPYGGGYDMYQQVHPQFSESGHYGSGLSGTSSQAAQGSSNASKSAGKPASTGSSGQSMPMMDHSMGGAMPMHYHYNWSNYSGHGQQWGGAPPSMMAYGANPSQTTQSGYAPQQGVSAPAAQQAQQASGTRSAQQGGYSASGTFPGRGAVGGQQSW